MLSLRKITLTLAFLGLTSVLFAQGEIAILPVYNPTHVQLKVTTSGRCLSNSTFVTKADQELNIKAFSYKDEELIIDGVKVDLVRKGRKIASEEYASEINLKSLLSSAQDDDVLRFEVKKVYIKDENGKLQLYSDGMMNFNYRYRETESLGFVD